MTVSIMPMAAEDARDVARLAGQLGYPAAPDEVARNLKSVRSSSKQEVLVARIDPGGPVVGWVHVHEHLSIATGRRCEIGGLVVDEEARGKGVGTALISAAEQWAKAHALGGVRFSSRISRTRAHRLYERLGYRVRKTSHVFDKQIT